MLSFGRRKTPALGYGQCVANPMPAAELEITVDLVRRRRPDGQLVLSDMGWLWD